MGSILSAEADGFAAMDRYESQQVQNLLDRELFLPGDREKYGRKLSEEERHILLQLYCKYKHSYHIDSIFDIFCRDQFDVQTCDICRLEYLHDHKCRYYSKGCNDCGNCPSCDAITISYL